MNLRDYRDKYIEYSRKASDISRQLSFAGIALIWIFRFGNDASLSIPQNLLWPALLLVAALAVDLLQYVLGTLIWWLFYRHHEKRGAEDDDEFDAPLCFPLLMWVCFFSKITLVAVAYALIFKHVLIIL